MVSARRGTLRLLRALMVGAVVVPAALLTYAAWVTWGSIVRLTDDRLVRSLDVLHEQALKVLTTGNLVLDEIVESVEDATPDQITAREGELHRRLKRVADLLPQVQSIWVLDRDGYALANSYFVPAPRGASLADRDFFRAQVDRDIGTYVSSVFTPRLIDGPAFFSMSRRLRGPGDTFQGIASVSLLPSDFEKFYREIARGPGEVFALMRDDGAFLARWPSSPTGSSPLPPRSLFFQEIARAPQHGLYSGVSRIDGIERRVGYRRIDGFPVYVVASVDAATMRSEWLAGLRSHLVFGLPATLLLLWVLWVAHQRTASLYAEAMRREAAETALRQAQRLEAVGRLTGGVAHDFNNLLMVISGSAERLRRLVDGEKEGRLVEMITTAAKRGETLTRQLLSFSRQQAVSPQSIDLSQRMPELSELIRRSLADDVEVTIDVPGRVCPVKVDPGEFEVAVLNICVNARDAMPKGGRLLVRVRDAVLDEEGENGLAGAFVSLSFTDTGTGIPEDLLPRVFEPFFTTKETAKGTGLGLSQVYGFARQAGGDVRITSRVGEGTTVTLWLPWVAFEPSAMVEPSPEPVARPTERRTVMVVEDNRSVADVCGAYLEQLGYEVRVAASPRDALAILRGADATGAQGADDTLAARRAGEASGALRAGDKNGALRVDDANRALRAHGIDLVLSDILMPGGMSGVDLARELRTLEPGLPVVLMTGFSDRAGDVARDGFPVLRKPFDIAQLERELAAALARRDGFAAA